MVKFKIIDNTTWDASSNEVERIYWIVGVIKACWHTFLLFVCGVITIAGAILKAIRWMIDKLISKIDNWRDKIKKKVIRFFVVKTNKNSDGFKPIIKKAQDEGKIIQISLDLNEPNTTTANDDVHIVQTDGDLNLKHLYTVKGDKFGEDFRKQCGQDVTEINLNL